LASGIKKKGEGSKVGWGGRATCSISQQTRGRGFEMRKKESPLGEKRMVRLGIEWGGHISEKSVEQKNLIEK